MVGVAGVEPATSCSQSKRASHCATPRLNVYIKYLLFRNYSSEQLDFSPIKLILFHIRGELPVQIIAAHCIGTQEEEKVL